MKSRKYWLIGVTAASCALFSLFFLTRPASFESTVVFYLSERPADKQEGAWSLPDHSPNASRIYHNATSTEMFDHLIKTFSLYEHYGIDTLLPLPYERLNSLMLVSITVHILENSGISVTVQDEDRAYAANMANELFRKLKEMTDRQLMEDLERSADLYRKVIERSEERSGQQVKELSALATDFKQRSGAGSRDAGDPATELNLELAKITSQLASTSEDLLRTRTGYEAALTLIRSEDLPSIFLLRKAMEDVRVSPLGSALVNIISLTVAIAFLSLIGMIVWFKHRDEFWSYLAEFDRGTPKV